MPFSSASRRTVASSVKEFVATEVPLLGWLPHSSTTVAMDLSTLSTVEVFTGVAVRWDATQDRWRLDSCRDSPMKCPTGAEKDAPLLVCSVLPAEWYNVSYNVNVHSIYLLKDHASARDKGYSELLLVVKLPLGVKI